MHALQREGVPAGVVQCSERMYHDIHMRRGGFIDEAEHDNLGRMEQPTVTTGLSATPGRVLHGMSTIESTKDRVFGDRSGNPPERIQELDRAGAL